MIDQRICKVCNSLIDINKHNYKLMIYCSKKCREKFNDKKRYLKRKKYLSINSINYYHKNSDKVLKKQVIYKTHRYKTDQNFRKKDNIRKFTAHSISLIGKICEKCGLNNDLQRHHPDYSKPLEIVILCRKCHNKTHEKSD